ncbi:MAG: YIP1 family protein [Paracoccaceae bacterium]
MTLNLSAFLQIARVSMERPREGARQILNLGLSTSEAWIVLALMAVASTLTAELGTMLSPYPSEPMVSAVFASPFMLALLQFTVMSCASMLMFALGRWAGGTGQFDGALVMVGWLQAILLLLQLVQLVVLLAFPVLAAPVGLFGLVLFGWLLTNFTAELHGFHALGKVFLCILAALIGFSLFLAIVLVVVFGVKA